MGGGSECETVEVAWEGTYVKEFWLTVERPHATRPFRSGAGTPGRTGARGGGAGRYAAVISGRCCPGSPAAG
eukprot:3539093-Pleurochrysis_carterae.AAC.1